MRAAAAVVGLLFSVSALAGPVYKWVDAAGRFHFSDTPQPGWTRVDAGRVNTVTAEVPADDGQGEAERAAQCKQKQDTLASFRNSSKVIERDALGVEREYTPEQRQKLIDLTERQVREACGEP